jgi:hypothetical protein
MVESNERLYVYFILPTNTVRGAPAFLQSKSPGSQTFGEVENTYGLLSGNGSSNARRRNERYWPPERAPGDPAPFSVLCFRTFTARAVAPVAGEVGGVWNECRCIAWHAKSVSVCVGAGIMMDGFYRTRDPH